MRIDKPIQVDNIIKILTTHLDISDKDLTVLIEEIANINKKQARALINDIKYKNSKLLPNFFKKDIN